MLDPTPDAFRALARSSPWRWRRLHLTWRHPYFGDVEAWVERPGRLRVRQGADIVTIEDGPGSNASGYVAPPPPASYAATYPWRAVPPQEVEPRYRPDGLVAERPWWVEDERLEVRYGDPMWQTYTWVAMLDPVELSHHVDVEDVRETEVQGRRTWRAVARPLPGYQPVCGCCALLLSEISERDERGDDYRPPEGVTYPDAYAVALDVETAVVVGIEPIGGSGIDGYPWTTTIHGTGDPRPARP